MNLNKLDTIENDRPLDPPKLIKTHVIKSIFDDIAPRVKMKKVNLQEKS